MAVGRWLLKMGPKGILIYCGSAKMEGSWRRGSVGGMCAKGIQPTASVQSSTIGLPKIPALHMVEMTGGQQKNQRQSIPLDPVHEGNMTDKEMVPSQAWDERDGNSQSAPQLLLLRKLNTNGWSRIRPIYLICFAAKNQPSGLASIPFAVFAPL